MFVGETGVERVVQRTAELMKQDPNGDARAQGGIPLDMIQKYLNLWFALSLDLFGGEISSNAASFFAAGLKGRDKEESYEDHLALDQHYRMAVPKDGAVVEEDVPLRNAMNEVLRDAYVEDCQRGVDRWNKRLAEAGLSERLRLPSKRFYRHIGLYADLPFDPDGRLLTREEWDQRQGRVAAHRRRTGLRRDRSRSAVREPRPDRELAGQARPRDQGPALRVRVRAAGLN